MAQFDIDQFVDPEDKELATKLMRMEEGDLGGDLDGSSANAQQRQLEEALAILDGPEPATREQEAEVLPSGKKPLPKWHKHIPAAIEKNNRYLEENKKSLYPALRRQQRQEYAAKRAAEGRPVRTYTDRSHDRLPNELAEDRKRRLDREAKRREAGKTAETVRGYKRLDDLTSEQKAERRRAQNASSKRRQRKLEAKRKTQPKLPVW